MSTTFNFPANPAVGDTVVLPSGASAQWNGTEWVSLADSSATVVYPLPVAQGGTGAATAANARFNLGLNTATGEFIVQKDGTVGAPGIAFASEPGLGFYRSAIGFIRMAASGVDVFAFDAAAAGLSSLSVGPKALGGGQVVLNNNVIGSANRNQLQIIQISDGSASIKTLATGTATRGKLTLDAQQIDLDSGTGVVFLPKGQLTFVGVPNPSNDPNTLDDYREGTWTPTNSAGVPMTVNTATYTKIGRLVFIQAQITFGANSNTTASPIIGGLPFVTLNTGPLAIGYTSIAVPAAPVTLMAMGSGVNFYMGSGWCTFAQFSGKEIYFGGCYNT